jgi:glycerol-3-phosphate dehydrogenase
VLILGAGINGAALARELVLNGVPVVVVDTADLSSGATSASSRLIHGGLRYLEYGEFDLVREALEERTRLLRLAPHLVRPLELFIPVRTRTGGALSAVRRLLGTRQPAHPSRGLWLVRTGLRWYDAYARDPALPQHRIYRGDDPQALPVDAARYRWQCSYFDAQVQFPERMTVALLEDARRAAEQTGAALEVHTYCRVRLAGKAAEVRSVRDDSLRAVCEPAVVMNATGAWVDGALAQLGVSSQRLIGGTKGSHFLTNHARLKDLLSGRGVYAEAADGRPVFILPLGQQALIGTTDVPFEGDPREAVATEEELDYLLAAANQVFPDVKLSREDVDWHYAGVRPLPYVDRSVPASITRRHWLHEHAEAALPMYSVIGGKLTTCRSLAEMSTATVLRRLGWPVKPVSRSRPLPGGDNYPGDAAAILAEQQHLADELQISAPQAAAVWQLCGNRAAEILSGLPDRTAGCLDGTHLPLAFARQVIQTEWACTLEDLVLRRLMLVYQPRLARRALEQLVELLVAEGKCEPLEKDRRVQDLIDQLRQRHGKAIQ